MSVLLTKSFWLYQAVVIVVCMRIVMLHGQISLDC